jgi:hypothetical protein
MEYTLRGRVWLYPGEAAWHFVNVSKAVSQELKETFGGGKGFGSLPVKVTVGQTSWQTSIFPDKKSGVYLLPIKAEVRKKERITDGTMLSYTIHIQL